MEKGHVGGRLLAKVDNINREASADYIPPHFNVNVQEQVNDPPMVDLLEENGEFVRYDEEVQDIVGDVVEDIRIRFQHEEEQDPNHIHIDSENDVEKKIPSPISSDSSLKYPKPYLPKTGRKNCSRNSNLVNNGESRIQIYTVDSKKPQAVPASQVKVKELGAVDSDEPAVSSIYLTSCLNKDGSEMQKISASNLETHVENLLVGKVRMQETTCGLVMEFTKEEDLERVLKLQMAQIFGHAVIVWQFPIGLRKYKKVVTVKGIPWCVPIKEIQNALNHQGIKASKVMRRGGNIRIEIKNANDLERLLQEGLSFFDCATFPVTLEVVQHGYEEPEIIQCYRCQRFWHTAAHCRYSPRCVRCGMNHDVSSCDQSRSSVKCCLCGGRHHAAHKLCPVRQQHINALQVELSLSKKHVPFKSYD